MDKILAKATTIQFVASLEQMAQQVEKNGGEGLGRSMAFHLGKPWCVIGHALDKAGVRVEASWSGASNNSLVAHGISDLPEKAKNELLRDGGPLCDLLSDVTSDNDNGFWAELPEHLRAFAQGLKKEVGLE